ncbi:MAG: metallophosphoesterase [Planctomycetota bacterium]|nr:metallophosphoesterase [Planctomycetota bacterium]
MTRRIFIGDIQGCLEELERLLEALGFDPETDDLQPVGDLVNRGPDSAGVLRLLRSLGAGGVLGNHDLHLLHFAAGIRAPRAEDTLDELLAADDREELCAWLAERPFVRRWPDVYLVHAGLDPSWDDPVNALADVDPLAPSPAALVAVRVRHCGPRGELPERDHPPPLPPFAPWHAHYEAARHGGRTVVFGHWARRGLVQRPHLRGLDTGCVWGGKLTAWIAEEDRLVQVDARRVYARHGA